MKNIIVVIGLIWVAGFSAKSQTHESFTENKLIGYKSTFSNAVVIQPKYEDGDKEVKINRIAVKKNGKWGLIDTTDKIIVPFEYEAIHNPLCGNTVSAQKNGKWGLIDTKTNQTIIPFEYEDMGNVFIAKIYNTKEEVLEMNVGFIAAKKEGKWGFIDEKNNPQINFIFDDVDDECMSLILPKIVNDRKIKVYLALQSKHIPAVLYKGEWYRIEYNEEKKRVCFR